MNDLDRALEAEVLAQELTRFAENLRSNAAASVQPIGLAAAQDSGRRGWRGPSHVEIARTLYHRRREREKFLPPNLFGEPAWDMLLDLYIKQMERCEINVTSVCIGSCVPASTALRWIAVLEQHGLLKRYRAPDDNRVMYVRLTDDGVRRTQRYLRSVSTEGAEEPREFLLRAK